MKQKERSKNEHKDVCLEEMKQKHKQAKQVSNSKQTNEMHVKDTHMRTLVVVVVSSRRRRIVSLCQRSRRCC
jgi:hypothetical protein